MANSRLYDTLIAREWGGITALVVGIPQHELF